MCLCACAYVLVRVLLWVYFQAYMRSHIYAISFKCLFSVSYIKKNQADHGNFFRQNYFGALLKHNIGLLIVCNPFYGKRKPKGQVSSYIRKVSLTREDCECARVCCVSAYVCVSLLWVNAYSSDCLSNLQKCVCMRMFCAVISLANFCIFLFPYALFIRRSVICSRWARLSLQKATVCCEFFK